jgi:hypothetical protein
MESGIEVLCESDPCNSDVLIANVFITELEVNGIVKTTTQKYDTDLPD